VWITKQWLNDYVAIEQVEPNELADKLTNGGIPVEVTVPLDKGVEGVVVGLVCDVQPHPNADKLRVCSVNVGEGELLHIVCGAPNVAAGQRVPVALVGAKLPDLVIKKAKLRGVESAGMLCSAREIGLNTRLLKKEQTEGLFILPIDAVVGSDIRDVLFLRDVAMELELTPNRSDCLSMRGVAYEVSALFGKPNTLSRGNALQTKRSANSGSTSITVEIESPLCEMYTALCVRGVTIAASPLWLQSRLMAVGVRPINNIVDVTNYVMFEYGQPLHAFDLAKIQGSRIIVRQASESEQITTLDEVERELDATMLTIADAKRPIALAGVMGGANSEVDGETCDIVLESAWFEPMSTRATVKRLGLRSEASLRFEKGVDPEAILPAIQRAAELICELAGGDAEEVVVAGEVSSRTATTIMLRPNRVREVLGVDLDIVVMKALLARLELEVSGRDDVLEVVGPTRRPDLVSEIDLIEEIGRLYGYDSIPTTLPSGVQTQGKLTEGERFCRIVRNALVDLGMDETVTYVFTNPDALYGYRLAEAGPEYECHIPLAHPMSEDRKALRTHMLPSLVEVAVYNLNRKAHSVRLFEFGKVFTAESLPLTALPTEKRQLCGLIAGSDEVSYGAQKRVVDFYEAKGLVETILDTVGIKGAVWRASSRPWMHPKRTAEVTVGERLLGYVGQIHPDVLEQAHLPEAYYFELDMSALFCHTDFAIECKPLPRYPAIERDLAVIVDNGCEAGRILDAISNAGGHLLERVDLFDVYVGAPIPVDRKSLAYSLVYRAGDRTLTDEEVGLLHQSIVDRLSEEFGAYLRM